MRKLYSGCVEDRNDPLKLGRCRVRIVGIHTDDKGKLPTASLPWASPILPITSAGVSGIGAAPVGPVPGSWVAISFLDDDMQQPMMVGTVPGLPQSEAAKKATENSDAVVINGKLIKPDGKPLTGSNGISITLDQLINSDERNDLVESLKNDTVDKLTNSVSGILDIYHTAQEIIDDPSAAAEDILSAIEQSDKIQNLLGIAGDIQSLKTMSPELLAGNILNELNFLQAEGIIDSQALDAINTLTDSIGSVVDAATGVVSDVINAATGVVDAATGMISDALDSAVDAVTDAAEEVMGAAFSGIADGAAALISSVASLPNDIIKSIAGSLPTDKIPVNQIPIIAKDALAKLNPAKQLAMLEDRDKNAMKGFTDPFGKYPLKTTVDSQDTNPLARGESKGTIHDFIKKSRTTGIPGPNGEPTWDQPKIEFGGQYPYCSVSETESGHVSYQDNTPGKESTCEYHRSGSFHHTSANGQTITKIINKSYTIIDADGNVSIQGNCNVAIGGNISLIVKGNANIQVMGNTVAKLNQNADIEVGGTANVHVKGATTMRCDSTVDWTVGSSMTLDVTGILSVRAQAIALSTTSGSVTSNIAGNITTVGSGGMNMNMSGPINIKGSTFNVQ